MCIDGQEHSTAPTPAYQPTGGQPSPELIEEAMRHDGFLPPLADPLEAMREVETPDPNLCLGDDGYAHLH